MELVEKQSSIIDLGPHLKFYFKLMLRRTQRHDVTALRRIPHSLCARALHHNRLR